MYEGEMTHKPNQEMKRLKITMMGVNEMRWLGLGLFCVLEHNVHYAETNELHHMNGVAVILNRKASRNEPNMLPLSERLLLEKLQIRPVNTKIIQICSPTVGKPDEDVE